MRSRDASIKAAARRKLLTKAVADILVKALKEFTPKQLENAINGGWSLVGFFSSQPPERALAFLQSIPSVTIIYLGMRNQPEAMPLLLKEMEAIPAADIWAVVAERLPEHAQILEANPQWVAQELAQIKSLMT